MEPIFSDFPDFSGVQTSPALRPLSSQQTKEGDGTENSAAPLCPQRPTRDTYVPEEKQEPSGRYWIDKGEDGTPKVYFDAPAQAAPTPSEQQNGTDKAVGGSGEKAEQKKASGKGEEICRSSTDKVDREIEKLKKKLEELQRQLASETDETKRQVLEQKLSQVTQELRQKDNDAYRRQHTVFS